VKYAHKHMFSWPLLCGKLEPQSKSISSWITSLTLVLTLQLSFSTHSRTLVTKYCREQFLQPAAMFSKHTKQQLYSKQIIKSNTDHRSYRVFCDQSRVVSLELFKLWLASLAESRSFTMLLIYREGIQEALLTP